MKNIILAFTFLFSGLLLANGKPAAGIFVEKNSVVNPSDDISKTAGIISNLLSVFDEGIIQPGTVIGNSAFKTVRTFSFTNSTATDNSQSRINRQTISQYINLPLADVRTSTALNVLLQVFLI